MRSRNLPRATIRFSAVVIAFLLKGLAHVFLPLQVLLAVWGCSVTLAQAANTFNEPNGRFVVDLPDGWKLGSSKHGFAYEFAGPGPQRFLISWIPDADKRELISFGRELVDDTLDRVVEEGQAVDLEVNGNPAQWAVFRGELKGAPMVALLGVVSMKRCGSSAQFKRCGIEFLAFVTEDDRQKWQTQIETAFRSIRDVGSQPTQDAKRAPISGGEIAKKSESQPPLPGADELPKPQSTEGRLVTREMSLGKPPAEFFTSTLPGEHMDYRAMLIPLTYAMLPGQPGKWVTVPRGPGNIERVYVSRGKASWGGAAVGFAGLLFAAIMEAREQEQIRRYYEIGPGSLRVSPDSRHVAYGVARGKNRAVAVDGNEGNEYERIVLGSLFSPDGKRFAYVAKPSGKWVVVVDGVDGKQYDEIVNGPTFSPDSTRLAYAAERGGKCVVVVDGAEQREYRSPIMRHPLFRTKIRFGVDTSGEPRWFEESSGSYLLQQPVFSPDSKRVAYVARSGFLKAVVVVDGVERKEYGHGASLPVFSPDSNRLAFAARRGGKWVVVVDGVEGRKYDKIRGVSFSPDSKQVSYVAKQGKKWVVVEEGVEGREYDDSEATLAQLRSADDATSASVSEAIEEERSTTEEQGGRGTPEATRVSGKVLSADGKHAAYAAARGGNYLVVVDGIESKEYDFLSPPVFDSPTSLHAVALRDQEFFRVEIQIPQ